MSRMYKCPNCKRFVALSKITPSVLDVNGPLHWQCGVCKETAEREHWGKADGIPATAYYFYRGASAHESWYTKLPRAIVRKSTFAGDLESLRDLQAPLPQDPDLKGAGNAYQVAIYHQGERYSLRGHYFLPNGPKPRKVVLLLSGSGNTAHHYLLGVARRYCKRLGLAVLLMDYRGFGASDPIKPSERGLFVDAQAMFRFLTDDATVGGLDWAPKDVIIHGFSLGTGVATELAARETRACGVVLQCPFTSAAEMARGVGKAILGSPGGAMAAALSRQGAHLDVLGKVPGLRRPVLVLIANDDTGMRSHGESIVEHHIPGLSVAHYDGKHEEPQNAFKDGRKPQIELVSTKDAPRGVFTVKSAQATKGQVVPKDRSQPLGEDNWKVSKGLGCLPEISNWIATL